MSISVTSRLIKRNILTHQKLYYVFGNSSVRNNTTINVVAKQIINSIMYHTIIRDCINFFAIKWKKKRIKIKKLEISFCKISSRTEDQIKGMYHDHDHHQHYLGFNFFYTLKKKVKAAKGCHGN